MNALIVYGQHRTFRRGDPTPPEDTPPNEVFWVPTRLASLALVFPDGGRVYFDLRLAQYPSHGEPFTRIINDLANRGETPFRHWVSLSSGGVVFDELKRGDPHVNWESIVDVLGSPPSQFVGDVFWRVSQPAAKLRTLHRTEEQLTRMVGSVAKVYQVKSRWHLKEGKECSISVVSHTPKEEGSDPPQRYVELATQGTRLTTQPAKVRLRRYTEETIKVRAQRSEQASSSEEPVHLQSTPPREDWPVGPDFSLHFIVEKSKTTILNGLALVALTIVGGILASQVGSTAWKLVWGTTAGFAGIGAALLFFGKWQLPKG